MTGPELAHIRRSLGLSVIEFGRAVGYEGSDETVSSTIRRYESPRGRHVPRWIGRLALMFHRHGIPDEFLRT
jgi:hypothetical protein